MIKKYKLVVFDLDGTLTVQKSSWGIIHKYFGTNLIAKKYLDLYLEGKIDYNEFMQKDIGSWPKPLHISEISHILSKFNLKDEVKYVLNIIFSKGIKIAIISAGIDLLAYQIANKFQIKHVYSNHLAIDKKGFLTGKGIINVEPKSKHLILIDLVKKLRLNLEECIAVDDSIYSLKFLQTAGIGLFMGQENLEQNSSIKIIRTLDDILTFL